MRLKTATLWALIGLILLTVLQVSDFIVVIVSAAQGPNGGLTVLTSAVRLLACSGVTAFMWASYKARR